MKRFSVSILLSCALGLTACGGGSGNNSNAQNQEGSTKTQEQTHSREKGGQASAQEDKQSPNEADYQEAPGENYKLVVNDRFGFKMAIPKQWEALNKSANQDGFFIKTGNENTDLRVYGEEIGGRPAGLGAPECDEETSFTFTSGEGTKCISGKTVMYYREKNDKRITFYVEAPKKWREANQDILKHMAKSLGFKGEAVS